MRCFFLCVLLHLTFGCCVLPFPARAQQTTPLPLPDEIAQVGPHHNTLLRATGTPGHIVGFDLSADDALVAPVRFTSKGLITCAKAEASTRGLTSILVFENLTAEPDCGLELQDSRVVVSLTQGQYPIVAFRLNIKAFDPAKWQAAVGKQPFHFLTLAMSEATVWQQGGWLCATPRADLYPLLLAPPGDGALAAGFNHEWSGTPPLAASPLPVIGLWSPALGRYAAWDLQTARLTDGSERMLATGFCNRLIVPPMGTARQPASEVLPPTQPFDTPGSEPMYLQQTSTQVDTTGISKFVALVYPGVPSGSEQGSVPAFPKGGERLVSQMRLAYSSELGPQDDPNRFLWDIWWHDERLARLLPRVPIVCTVGEAPAANATPNLTPEALQTAMQQAKRIRVNRENALGWPSPLVKPTMDTSGRPNAEPAATLHNPQQWDIARQLVAASQTPKGKACLPLVEGALTWAKYVVWQRGSAPDALAAPTAADSAPIIGFLLAYYTAFQNDAERRTHALEALALAHSFAYRSLVCWTTNADDGAENKAFRWQTQTGHDAPADPPVSTLETLARAATATGDPILLWALQGSLSRLPELHSSLLSPIENTEARIVAGERAAIVTNRGGWPVTIQNYRYAGAGEFAFMVRTTLRRTVNVTVTFPSENLSAKSVALVRSSITRIVLPQNRILRDARSPETLVITGVRDRDTLVIGTPALAGVEVLPSAPPLTTNR